MEIQIRPEDHNSFMRALEYLVMFKELNDEIAATFGMAGRQTLEMDQTIAGMLREHSFFVYDDAEPNAATITGCERDEASGFVFTLSVTSTAFEWLARGVAFSPAIRVADDLKIVMSLKAGIDQSSQDKTLLAYIQHMEIGHL